ncbi:MAG: polymer-forming cytoskeletal protein [Gammaproteobacteria bacterium]
MWKKDDSNSVQPEPGIGNYIVPEKSNSGRASIGSTISIKGDLTGDEDLLIDGRIEGKIDLKQHKITVGKKGVVRAEMRARIISIEGDVQGTLYGEEQIVLCKTSSVRGDIIAPRVTLEDGSKFKGSIDMEPKSTDKVYSSNSVMAEIKPVAANPEQGKAAYDQSGKMEQGVKANPRMG